MTELEISVETLAARRAAGEELHLLDVREPWEFKLCRIEGSVNVPLGRLADAIDPDTLNDGRPVIVICHHGFRSLRATLWLRGQGVADCLSLAGGVERWANVVEPAMARY
ncbi:MAG: rhodanese-like domain-containing protein [Zavarzinia sp.]|nr:rhodanese-like domain-containing protein [Zavarzinia sp.]